MSSKPPYLLIATASINWVDGGGAAHLRVYCTGDDATVEWCLDQGGNWYRGQYTTS